MALAESVNVERLASVRDVRAAEEYLTTVEFVPGMFHVYSEAGTEYTVDPFLGACTCPDVEYRNKRCKHIRRVEMERGDQPVPDVDVDTNLLRALEDEN